MHGGERQLRTSLSATLADAGEGLSQLRAAVAGGHWGRVAALAGSVVPAGDGERPLLARLAVQAALHARAEQALALAAQPMREPHAPAAELGDTAARAAAGEATELTEADCQLTSAVLRNLAAIDGDRSRAVALLLEGLPPAAAARPGQAVLPATSGVRPGQAVLPATSGARPGQAVLPRVGIRDLVRSQSPDALHRVLGVARPAGSAGLAVGDAGSADEVMVAAPARRLARGTPVELVGSWESGSGRFHWASLVTLGQVPDYAAACEAVEQLCAAAGLAAEPLDVRVISAGELDESVARARRRRRLLEWDDLLAAAGLLEDALSTSQLSLAALARVHKIVVGAATAGSGQLRQTPAVIRWRRVITYRAPPVAARGA